MGPRDERKMWHSQKVSRAEEANPTFAFPFFPSHSLPYSRPSSPFNITTASSAFDLPFDPYPEPSELIEN